MPVVPFERLVESTVDKLHKTVELFLNKFNASQTMRGRVMTFLK